LKEAIVSISFPSIYFHLLGSSEKSSIFFFQPRECLPCPKSTILQKDSQMSDPWSISITSGSGRAQRSIISIGLVAVVSVVISVSRVALCLAFAHISFSDAFQRVFIHPYKQVSHKLLSEIRPDATCIVLINLNSPICFHR